MDKRLTFNEDVIKYDKWRPCYCEALFSDIITYSNLDSQKIALEIGCGTGQATESIINTGCSVIAIELGNQLAEYTKQKFSKHSNFDIQNTEFEKYICSSDTFDLIYSATAFHWIPEELGYTKVYNMLKSKGTVALFWNKPFVKRIDDPLHLKIDTIYEKYRGDGLLKSGKEAIENDTERYERIASTIKRYGFVDIECRLYKNTRIFDADGYVSLLNTYSDHISMPESIKMHFEEEIKDAIRSFGNNLKVYDTMDLYLARKP